MSSTTTFLGKHLHIQHPQVAEDIPKKLLELREVDDTEAFLRPNIDQLHDPFFLPDMQVCVDRILQAKQDGERVMIFGDYDADGVTSTAALFLFLKNDLGLDVSYRIPHRIDDGYGLKDYFVDEIAQT